MRIPIGTGTVLSAVEVIDFFEIVAVVERGVVAVVGVVVVGGDAVAFRLCNLGPRLKVFAGFVAVVDLESSFVENCL